MTWWPRAWVSFVIEATTVSGEIVIQSPNARVCCLLSVIVLWGCSSGSQTTNDAGSGGAAGSGSGFAGTGGGAAGSGATDGGAGGAGGS